MLSLNVVIILKKKYFPNFTRTQYAPGTLHIPLNYFRFPCSIVNLKFNFCTVNCQGYVHMTLMVRQKLRGYIFGTLAAIFVANWTWICLFFSCKLKK